MLLRCCLALPRADGGELDTECVRSGSLNPDGIEFQSKAYCGLEIDTRFV